MVEIDNKTFKKIKNHLTMQGAGYEMTLRKNKLSLPQKVMMKKELKSICKLIDLLNEVKEE